MGSQASVSGLQRARQHHERLMRDLSEATSAKIKVYLSADDKEYANNNFKVYDTECDVCSQILELLDKRLDERHDHPCPTSQLSQVICSEHAKLVPNLTKSGNELVRFVRPANQQVIHVQYGTINAEESGRPGWEELSFSATADRDLAAAQHHGPRMIPQRYIDVEMLQTWIANCEDTHQLLCGASEAEQASMTLPLLLVDTVQNCLVTVHERVRYFALSYVWGRANAFMTTASSLAALSNPGALSDTSCVIPRTISQAIALTKALGGQYLWVDALCIVQDDPRVAEQLDAMATLFSCATLTIVAADGVHADAGFKGLRGISAARHIEQQVMYLTPERALIRPHQRHVWTDEELQPWSTRAWTFQEAICSRRLLYLAHNTVRWVCKTCRLSEESTSPDCLQHYASFSHRQLALASPSVSASELPDMTELVALINGYNARRLTYPHDALNAFAGVVNILSRKFVGGFLAGLPAMFLDLCLLWRPLQRSGPALARTTPAQDSPLPSWSWAAYETEVSFPYSWMRQTDPAGPAPAMIRGLRPFFTTEISCGYARDAMIPILDSWLPYADRHTGDILPEGWKRHGTRHEFDPNVFGCHYTYKQHGDVAFWFPVAINDNERQQTGTSHVEPSAKAVGQPRFLFFKTTCARFRLGISKRSATQILADDGDIAGTLYAHNHEEAGFRNATTPPYPDRPKVSLVAVFGNTIPSEDFDVWQDPNSSLGQGSGGPQPRHRDPNMRRGTEVYNVLWTEVVDGLHFRKGTGVVDRAMWERNATEAVDIILA